MFENIRQHTIFYQGSPIHNDQAFQAMQHGWNMLQWMHDEFMAVANSRAWPDGFEQDTDSAMAADRTKAHALTLSYISMLGTVEGITKKLYEDIVGVSAASVDGARLFQTPASLDLPQIEQRKQEVEHIQKLRNKLSAHTSYAFPTHRGRTDSHSTQVTSVYLMQPQLFSPEHPETYGLGGTLIMSGGETHNEFRDLRFSIHAEHPKMTAHFRSWESMIIAVYQQLGTQCPVYTPYRLLRRSDPLDPPTTPSQAAS
jgi:hypothetical protein